jgi:hypothetical protein
MHQLYNITIDEEPVVILYDEEDMSSTTISDGISPNDTEGKIIAKVSEDYEIKPKYLDESPGIVENNRIEDRVVPNSPKKESRVSTFSVDSEIDLKNDENIIRGIAQFMDETDNDGVVLSSLIKTLSANK